MGLLQTIKEGVDTAFDSVDDLVVLDAVVHRRVRNEFDDNVLRTVIEYEDNTIPKVLVLSFTAEELENRGILPTDQKVLIKGVDSPVIPIPEDDQITISGVLWQIKGVSTAPMNVLITLRVRTIE